MSEEDDTEIVLELTPRQAAVILQLINAVSTAMGSYSQEVESLHRLLEKIPKNLLRQPPVNPVFGYVDPDTIWLNEQTDLTIERGSL